MSHTQHTPGPWSTYRGEDTNYWWIIRDAEGHELGSGDGGFEKDDAHLIAAAPELYAELEMLCNVIEGAGIECIPPEIEARISCSRDALAKARGEA